MGVFSEQVTVEKTPEGWRGRWNSSGRKDTLSTGLELGGQAGWGRVGLNQVERLARENLPGLSLVCDEEFAFHSMCSWEPFIGGFRSAALKG